MDELVIESLDNVLDYFGIRLSNAVVVRMCECVTGDDVCRKTVREDFQKLLKRHGASEEVLNVLVDSALAARSQALGYIE